MFLFLWILEIRSIVPLMYGRRTYLEGSGFLEETFGFVDLSAYV